MLYPSVLLLSAQKHLPKQIYINQNTLICFVSCFLASVYWRILVFAYQFLLHSLAEFPNFFRRVSLVFSHSFWRNSLETFSFLISLENINSAVVACLLISSSTYKLIFFISASVSRFGRGDATEESTGTRSIFEKLLETDPDQPSFEEFLTKAVIFGAIMLYFWLCDYQHVW